MYKKFLFIIVVNLFFCTNLFANEKIVFIDTNYIFNNSNAGKKFTSLLEKKLQNLNSDLQKYKKETDASEKKLISQKNIISDEEYSKKLSLLKGDIQKFNESISLKQEDIKKFKNNAGNKYAEELRIILEDFSKKNSILIVIKKENILIGKKDVDITNQILEIFDNKISSLIK